MKTLWLCFLLLTTLLISCDSETAETEKSEKELVRFAKHFSIVEENGKAHIKVFSPDNGKVEHEISLDLNSSKPLERLAVLSSTHVGMMGKLSVIDKIVGISSSKYVYNPELLKRIKNKQVFELGEESQIPVESILNSNCEAIIYSGFGKTFPHQKQLKTAGVECIANYDWRELHPLGKAEWILLFGYLTGKEKEAHTYFNIVVAEYQKLLKIAQKANTKPSVISGNMWGDSWNAPSGESFNAQLFRDAYCNYVYRDSEGSGSIFLTLEKVISENENTKFWFNTGIPNLNDILLAQPKLQYFGPVKSNNIYDYSSAGNRFWENSACEPHKVLSDYLKILHPGLNIEAPLYFYQKVQ
jgi:iron complex transport system substrate-binding protein